MKKRHGQLMKKESDKSRKWLLKPRGNDLWRKQGLQKKKILDWSKNKP